MKAWRRSSTFRGEEAWPYDLIQLTALPAGQVEAADISLFSPYPFIYYLFSATPGGPEIGNVIVPKFTDPQVENFPGAVPNFVRAAQSDGTIPVGPFGNEVQLFA